MINYLLLLNLLLCTACLCATDITTYSSIFFVKNRNSKSVSMINVYSNTLCLDIDISTIDITPVLTYASPIGQDLSVDYRYVKILESDNTVTKCSRDGSSIIHAEYSAIEIVINIIGGRSSAELHYLDWNDGEEESVIFNNCLYDIGETVC